MKSLTELLGLDPVSRYERLVERKNNVVEAMNYIIGTQDHNDGWEETTHQRYERLENRFNGTLEKISDLRKKYPDVKEIQ